MGCGTFKPNRLLETVSIPQESSRLPEGDEDPYDLGTVHSHGLFQPPPSPDKDSIPPSPQLLQLFALPHTLQVITEKSEESGERKGNEVESVDDC
jgi:hypothetical protein